MPSRGIPVSMGMLAVRIKPVCAITIALLLSGCPLSPELVLFNNSASYCMILTGKGEEHVWPDNSIVRVSGKKGPARLTWKQVGWIENETGTTVTRLRFKCREQRVDYTVEEVLESSLGDRDRGTYRIVLQLEKDLQLYSLEPGAVPPIERPKDQIRPVPILNTD